MSRPVMMEVLSRLGVWHLLGHLNTACMATSVNSGQFHLPLQPGLQVSDPILHLMCVRGEQLGECTSQSLCHTTYQQRLQCHQTVQFHGGTVFSNVVLLLL